MDAIREEATKKRPLALPFLIDKLLVQTSCTSNQLATDIKTHQDKLFI